MLRCLIVSRRAASPFTFKRNLLYKRRALKIGFPGLSSRPRHGSCPKLHGCYRPPQGWFLANFRASKVLQGAVIPRKKPTSFVFLGVRKHSSNRAPPVPSNLFRNAQVPPSYFGVEVAVSHCGRIAENAVNVPLKLAPLRLSSPSSSVASFLRPVAARRILDKKRRQRWLQVRNKSRAHTWSSSFRSLVERGIAWRTRKSCNFPHVPVQASQLIRFQAVLSLPRRLVCCPNLEQAS